MINTAFIRELKIFIFKNVFYLKWLEINPQNAGINILVGKWPIVKNTSS